MDRRDQEGWGSAGGGSRGTVSWRGVPLAELTYTVIDLETTGLKPQGNGITEICCLRVVGGRVVDRFASLVNPGLPIPPFIQRMTGITDAMVRRAPSFGELAPAVLDFLGESVLVAHNAPFDLSFLNHGLYLSGRCHLHNQVVDTCRLARMLLPGLRSAGLDSVVLHLGVAVSGRHRATGDAEATAQVLLRLLSLCLERGIQSDAHLLRFLAPAISGGAGRARAAERDSTARLEVLARRCRSLPDAPGVYLMRSINGRILYVGKAVSLRRRLASYFNGGVPTKVKRLLLKVETIEHVQLGSELEALLEESRLIKQHQPPFNTLLRSYRGCPFIKIDETDRYPRLVLTHEIACDGAEYFGPFQNARSTELVLEILARCFRLYDGRCLDRSAGDSCIYRQMRRCLAPCLGPAEAAEYRRSIQEVCRLLEAEPQELVAELARRQDAAADRLDFESAALYRDAIEALDQALRRRRLLAPAVEGPSVLAVCPSLHPGCAELFVFEQGRLAARVRLFPGDPGSGRSSIERLLEMAAGWSGSRGRPPLKIDAERLDQLSIISNWLEGQGDAACTIPLDAGWATDGRARMVDRVLEAALIAARRDEA